MQMVEQRLADSDVSAWFDLNGTCLRIAARPDHLQPLLLYLAELRCPGPMAGARFDLSIGPQSFDPAPDGMALIFDGSLPENVSCRLYEAGDTRLLIVPGRLSARFSPAMAVMGVVAGSEWLIGTTAGILAIEAAAGLSAQTLVHAAALALPGRVAALMLFAPSGAGKTTTALALATAGFGFLTDDAVFLRAAAGHVVAGHVVADHMVSGRTASGHIAWGLPRPLKVHRRTATLLPTVGALLTGAWDKEGEQGVSRRTLAMVAPVPPPRPMPLAAIIFLGERTGDAASHMAPAPRGEVLVRLARDNVAQGPHGLLPPELRRFKALAKAVAETPVYELRVGRDLNALPDIVLRALGCSA